VKISSLRNLGIFLTQRIKLGPFEVFITAVILFFISTFWGCQSSPRDPVTLTFVDPEWSHDARERSLLTDAALQEFTGQTGIRVKHLPAPETSPAQLALVRDLLQKRAPIPDVYGIDVIWPGMLSEYLVDLSPYFAPQISSENPEVLRNYSVQGKLVAVPYHANSGVLYYRTDLLAKYGYKEPPKTWDELEKMALRIQNGERANGEKDFWGFVWPGAASEGLTCNALEWQFDDGGGHIIESDKSISVNNPNAIRAWERAARWVGWISPPSVLSYQEWDASNAFLNSNRAAFARGWSSAYFLHHPLNSPVQTRFGETSLPGGKMARVGTLGGFGLGISRSSAHVPEAIQLIRFLLRREARIEAEQSRSTFPQYPELYDLPTILKVHIPVEKSRDGASPVARPSTVSGATYEEVAQAYVKAVHSVLAGEMKAPDAAVNLEKQLMSITGFAPGPPSN
jgi:trehalose/maltose transport system substrate-binding protein